jgi:superfamily II DNA or RNA helicase
MINELKTFKDKTEIQDYAVELSNNNPNLCLELATGLGKSLAAIRIIEKCGGKWNIIINEIAHELNWKQEFIKYNKEFLLVNVNFICYASLHNWISNSNYVFDECHHLLSDKRVTYLQKIVSLQTDKLNILLSATLTWKQKDVLHKCLNSLKVFKINISQAVEWELLPKPQIYLIPIELDNTIRNREFVFNKDKKIKCTELECYNFLTGRYEYLKSKYFSSNDEFDKVKWLRSGNVRKQFLSSCKTKYAKTLLKKLESKRLVCFAGSIEQAKELNNSTCIHSKLSKKVIEKLISDFNNKEIDSLLAVGMIKEGMNLTDIEVGIIIQLDNQERYFTQINGRTMRAIYPVQYIFYVEETQDMQYVKTALENMNPEYIAEIQLDDI